MIQVDDKYSTVSGVKDSENIVHSEMTVCKGKNIGKKNETSAVDQAEKEILNRYKKQLKTGYFDNEEDALKGCSFVEPMLAKNYKDYSKKINFSEEKWVLQCKFNGNRCIATKSGLFTRKGERYSDTTKHIHDSLKPFFENHPDAVLDGELYNYELRQSLNELSKLVRKTVHITSEDLKKSEELVRFYVYDGYNFHHSENDSINTYEDVSYEIRKKELDRILIGKYDYIKKVESYDVKSVEDLDRIYKNFIDDGEEGGILRKIDERYEHKRSKFLLKLKPEDDDEAVIINITEGVGNWSGSGKVITLKWNDKTFDATFKGTYGEAVKFLEDKDEWIGKTVTFLYNGLTGLGVPNYARVDIKNCLKTDR